MSASRRFPMSRFQPGIAAMYASTGASPSAFAICGLPPESRTTATFLPSCTLIGLALLAPGLGFAPPFGGDLDLVADLRGLLARDVPFAFGFEAKYSSTELNLGDFISFRLILKFSLSRLGHWQNVQNMLWPSDARERRRRPHTLGLGPRNYSWTELLHSVFALDVLVCPNCSGRMRILAAIDPPEAIRTILDCLGIPSRAPNKF